MKINSIHPISPRQRAKKLKLQSNRFYEDHIGRNAEQAIEYVKKKDRHDLKVYHIYNISCTNGKANNTIKQI